MASRARSEEVGGPGWRSGNGPPPGRESTLRRNLRILLVDDSEAFKAGARFLLSRDPWLEIVGTADGGRQGVDRARELAPDLVLMDAMMPGMSGFEATALIKSQPGAPRVIVVTLHDTRALRMEAWAAGADDFVPKAALADELIPVIERLFAETEDVDDPGAPRGRVNVANGSPEPPVNRESAE